MKNILRKLIYSNPLLTSAAVLILIVGLGFQNCAKKFSSQCVDCEDWKSVLAEQSIDETNMKIAFYDEKQSEILLEDKDVFLKRSSEAIRYQKPQLYGEEFSGFVRIDSKFEGEVFNIYSGTVQAESASLTFIDGRIQAKHSSVDGVHYTISYPIPNTEDVMVGVYFGYRTQDIRMVINGKLIRTDDPLYQVDQTPGVVNFSYVQKQIKSTSGAKDLILFGRKVSTYELACLSRHFARDFEQNYVIFDDQLDPESDVDFVQERPEFIKARNVLKANACFKCHGSWVSYGEYNYVTNRLVAARQPAQSSLWTRLKGTIELDRAGKKKDMPLRAPELVDTDLDLIKEWILSIEVSQ